MLKVLIIKLLKTIMFSLLAKVLTTIESRLSVVCKKLSTRLKTCMKKLIRIFMFGVME